MHAGGDVESWRWPIAAQRKQRQGGEEAARGVEAVAEGPRRGAQSRSSAAPVEEDELALALGIAVPKRVQSNLSEFRGGESL